ncbi:MAG: hypothetical protein OCD76_14800 [Reichenbachiella sp.]
MLNKIISLIIVMSASALIAHSQTFEDPDTTATVEGEYKYRLPMLGQKAYERGYGDQLQLPLGLNVNYVNAYMELEMTEFELFVGDLDLSGIINTETLNFQKVSATTNGLNFRADGWILPFMNVYGLFSSVTGGTHVALKPTWKDAEGEIILEMDEFSSDVEFTALAYGLGTTLVFGWDNYFLNTDINYSATKTALLEEQIGYLTLSARAGYRFMLSQKKPDLFLAAYVGMMYRDFVGAKGSNGSINLDEVFPEADEVFNTKVDEKVQSNIDIIEENGWGPLHPERIKLEVQNATLGKIQDGVNDSGLFTTEINYFVYKEMVQPTTFQFGFNLQLNKHWQVRGEYGVSGSQRFLMSGVQYRFGIPKK